MRPREIIVDDGVGVAVIAFDLCIRIKSMAFRLWHNHKNYGCYIPWIYIPQNITIKPVIQVMSFMEDQSKKNYLLSFGEGLRNFRIKAGFSQEELAEKAGIDRSYLGGIERGEHNLALINIIKIAKALSLPPHKLLETLSTTLDDQNGC